MLTRCDTLKNEVAVWSSGRVVFVVDVDMLSRWLPTPRGRHIATRIGATIKEHSAFDARPRLQLDRDLCWIANLLLRNGGESACQISGPTRLVKTITFSPIRFRPGA